jgi:hypothetical protein
MSNEVIKRRENPEIFDRDFALRVMLFMTGNSKTFLLYLF